MEKQLKDYTHLYIGCKCNLMGEWNGNDHHNGPKVFTLKGIYEQNGTMIAFCDTEEEHNEVELFDVFPILRPLSDITFDEVKQLSTIVNNIHCKFDDKSIEASHIYTKQRILEKGNKVCIFGPLNNDQMSEAVRFLLKQHFDIYGLIEEKLAINSTNNSNEKKDY